MGFMSIAETQGASGRIGAGSLKATRNSLFCVTKYLLVTYSDYRCWGYSLEGNKQGACHSRADSLVEQRKTTIDDVIFASGKHREDNVTRQWVEVIG